MSFSVEPTQKGETKHMTKSSVEAAAQIKTAKHKKALKKIEIYDSILLCLLKNKGA